MNLKTYLLFLYLFNILLCFSMPSSMKEGILCNLCRQTQKKLFDFSTSNHQKIIDLAVNACKIAGPPEICNYFVPNKANYLLPLRTEFLKKSDYFCSILLKICPLKTTKFTIEEFKHDLVTKFPPQTIPIPKDSKPFKAIVIGDTHIQMSYKFKSKRTCSNGVSCCSERSGETFEKSSQAGFWGSPGSPCDLPKHFFDKSIQLIKDKHIDADALIVLGDHPAHDYFVQNEMYVSEVNSYVLNSLVGNFSIPVIPVLGNHECHPADYLNWDDPNSYVRKYIFPSYSSMISKQEMKQLVEDGFYERIFSENNLKLISFNSQFFDIFNDYLTKNATDPLGALWKLSASFYNSEFKGEKVILLTHIPISDHSTSHFYSKCLNVLLERFKETFGGMLSSHTHNDQLKFLKTESGEYFGMNYVSPSLTTFASYRPSYRVYSVVNGTIYDFDQFNVDLDDYNERAYNDDFDIEFSLAYNFRKEYNLNNIHPREFGILYDKLRNTSSSESTKYLINFFTEKLSGMENQRNYLICSLDSDSEKMMKCSSEYDSHGWLGGLPPRIFRFFFESDWFIDIDGSKEFESQV